MIKDEGYRSQIARIKIQSREVLQAQLRGIILTYASRKKRHQDGQERHLTTEIERDGQNLHEHIADIDWLNAF